MSRETPMSTALANHFKLSLEQYVKTDSEIEDMSKIPYSSADGCLMYFMVCTRPNLAQVVSLVCKFMSKLGKQHWEVVKWILRYLKVIIHHGIMFNNEQGVPSNVGYVDSDYAGDLDDRRSTTGYVFTLVGGPTCWKSSVQSIVAILTTEAEYMIVDEAAEEALWLTRWCTASLSKTNRYARSLHKCLIFAQVVERIVNIGDIIMDRDNFLLRETMD
ncbi:secreted RxLR effector protein 161-like [Lathyrus oleraceus]|uniref:secreted RxLR effector protein 161-like n=1 Tax=Pisum sativum TaxID=3888 RepID=UPI0021D2769F|nr:secreted RxLR effector protein 161-like [Pisum sativum]